MPELFAGIPNPPTPARLSVGVISAGRVGTALGSALERAGHVVTAVAAPSGPSRERAARRLPEATVGAPSDIAARPRRSRVRHSAFVSGVGPGPE